MIRTARVQDIEQCLGLLVKFANASIYNYADWQQEDLNNARATLLGLIKTGYLKVIDLDGVIVGMIGAQTESDPWIRRRRRIRELFWWVEPEYRSTRHSVELFKCWQTDTRRWIEQGLADQVSLSTQPGGSQIDLNKRGWQCVEQHWIKG